MYRPVLVTPPAIAPVTVAEFKAQSRVDVSDDDAIIARLISAATAHLDGWTGILGRALVEQTWRQDFDAFCRDMRLPLFPVISIASVAYDDASGAAQTIAGTNYRLVNDEGGAILRLNDEFAFPAVFDEAPAIRVTYVAGYPTTAGVSTVPESIKHAILLLAAHWYEHREAVVAGGAPAVLSMAVDALLAPYRQIRF